ncbi:probable NAD(P)H dehydrogenase (quinone) FQR1-like 1 [Rosa rugosa]|uniref:NAD(P)H dehydrogenase (quinone) n=2 Tax=Rosa chinensis TaxID=74649 RepID=A0A2P6PNV8_ROSCH|nr:probable NAD(P)H dehydrogenase (quinone) FQR1-like 1 [Rosa chinensis]XP_062020431.1 probable NAD(P)H dehydrogenase (quinone) FQR1-like 1 [Rosa rugosa]PRQ23596.1 putative NAD(P)H dehydrogenase (quinone) [Rosa chinensis]
MGKGGGCVPSKNRPPAGVAGADLPNPKSDDLVSDQNQTQTTETTNPIKDEGVAEKKQQRKKLRVFIVFYSMYGHVELLAREIKKGVDSTDGVEGVLYRVPETLSSEVLEQMKVPKKDDHGVPVIVPERLVEADGVLFGFPTRYGSMAAQMKAFFDSTGELWREQKLAGVPAGFFVSTGTQGGGQETNAWTAITQLAHHGMIYVPIGYTFGAGMFQMDSLRGGSPYGSGVLSGDGTRAPTETELALAEHHGKYMATIVKKLVH